MNESAKTITVLDVISKGEVFWKDIELQGNGTLPTETIKGGDVITNCTGTVALIYEPQDRLFGTWDFT